MNCSLWDVESVLELFPLFNDQYFYGSLGCVRTEWSQRMTLCAGICIFKGGNDVTIRLSEKLLQYRPLEDHIDTLLHEMIHAYLFLTKRIRDHDGHGADFQFHMQRINQLANSNITIYHKFHDEVDYHRRHVWQCNGICAQQPPHFGLVKRSMNRKPSCADYWWSQHERCCGGTFVKISEPSSNTSKGDKFSSSGTESKKPESQQSSLIEYIVLD